jgi:hypothetical protein
MNRFLDEYYDETFELSAERLRDWSPNGEASQRCLWLARNAKITSLAEQIPRRLGGDATPQELSADKKNMRRSSYMLRTQSEIWLGVIPEPVRPKINWDEYTDSMRISAAQMIFHNWISGAIVDTQILRKEITTRSVQTGNRKWANRVVNLLTKEIDGFTRIASS